MYEVDLLSAGIVEAVQIVGLLHASIETGAGQLSMCICQFAYEHFRNWLHPRTRVKLAEVKHWCIGIDTNCTFQSSTKRCSHRANNTRRHIEYDMSYFMSVDDVDVANSINLRRFLAVQFFKCNCDFRAFDLSSLQSGRSVTTWFTTSEHVHMALRCVGTARAWVRVCVCHHTNGHSAWLTAYGCCRYAFSCVRFWLHMIVNDMDQFKITQIRSIETALESAVFKTTVISYFLPKSSDEFNLVRFFPHLVQLPQIDNSKSF